MEEALKNFLSYLGPWLDLCQLPVALLCGEDLVLQHVLSLRAAVCRGSPFTSAYGTAYRDLQGLLSSALLMEGDSGS